MKKAGEYAILPEVSYHLDSVDLFLQRKLRCQEPAEPYMIRNHHVATVTD